MNGPRFVKKLFLSSNPSCLSFKSDVKYLDLLDDCESNRIRDLKMASVPNLVGFEDGNWYKIRNVGDKTVIELGRNSSKLKCMPEDSEKIDLQRFRAIRQPNGKYRIAAKYQKSANVIQVWDYMAHRELLMQRKQSTVDKYMQNWTSEHVPGVNSMYLIQSGPNEESSKCLKNMGEGEQIRLVSKSGDCIANPFVQWNLELQDLPS